MKKSLLVLLLVAMCVSACAFVGCDFIKGLFEKDTPKQYAYNADHHFDRGNGFLFVCSIYEQSPAAKSEHLQYVFYEGSEVLGVK